VVEFSADFVGLNRLNLTLNLALNLTLNLGPRGFLGRPRLVGGIECRFRGLKLAKFNVEFSVRFNAKFRPPGLPGPAASCWWTLVPISWA